MVLKNMQYHMKNLFRIDIPANKVMIVEKFLINRVMYIRE